MIGLGKWAGEISSSLFKASGIVEIKDKNGQYDFSVLLDNGGEVPEFKVTDIKEDGQKLSGKAHTRSFGNLTIDVSVEFHGDTFEGNIKVPFLGTIPITNGRRVE